jgi:hypothetical protein
VKQSNAGIWTYIDSNAASLKYLSSDSADAVYSNVNYIYIYYVHNRGSTDVCLPGHGS